MLRLPHLRAMSNIVTTLTGWKRCPYGGWTFGGDCCGGACNEWELYDDLIALPRSFPPPTCAQAPLPTKPLADVLHNRTAAPAVALHSAASS